MMQMDELLAQARDAMTVKRVFGDPIEKDGVTVIPVANVMGGAGGGGGEGPVPARGRRGRASVAIEAGGAGGATGAAGSAGAGGAGGATGAAGSAGAGGASDAATTSGMGMGFGIRATPAGVYVIKDGEVEWEPALDVTRVAIMGMFVGIFALLVVRSVMKSRAS